MAHRPIAIDGAGADGSAAGAGGVEPGQSNDHGGDGAVFPCVPGITLSDCFLRYSSTPKLLEPAPPVTMDSILALTSRENDYNDYVITCRTSMYSYDDNE